MSRKKWIFLGVALSIAWALIAGFRQHNETVANANNFADFAYKVCIASPAKVGAAGIEACKQERAEHLATWMANDDENVAFIALAPLPVGWLAGFILIMVWRIQVAGFRAVVRWGSLNRIRKLAVIGCGVAIAAGCFIFALTILNLYAETRTPVGLGSTVMVFESGDSVNVEGTWTRHGNSPGSEMGYPLQISRIVCTRSQNRCTEAKASVAEAGKNGGANTLLTPELTDYEVTSWANGIITYGSDDLCASESFSIDTNTKAVSGLGRATHEDEKYCNLHPPTDREWTYRMEDGFKVYWNVRQANRPLALKVVQSFFGD